ncbi:MAG: acylneuraminate cytidylyltransferase family protein [SAR86 cluster bacterium]|jgi:CMP-N-acetylneuraminic acid synthetase|nr:acylneuraminate cytidylyltransferase family protein [SAR86 cluster bacterium]
MTMKTFAFIFARGGSKGLPGKNLKKLGNTPLIGHSINLAKSIDLVDEVFVSTESKEIKSVSKDFGAEIIDRPSSLALDESSEWEAWQHAVKHLESKNRHFDYFLSLPPTAPLRQESDVLKCFDLIASNVDVVITASPSQRNPYFNMIFREKDGTSKLIFETNPVHRRQDAPEVYDVATAAYLSKPSFILNNNGIFDGKVKSVIIPRERAVDIDDQTDFLLTKTLYEE